MESVLIVRNSQGPRKMEDVPLILVLGDRQYRRMVRVAIVQTTPVFSKSGIGTCGNGDFYAQPIAHPHKRY